MTRATNVAGQRRAPGKTTLLFHGPAGYGKLVNPYDATASLDERARSYLHSNCAQCHVNAGGGNSQINLEYHQDLKRLKAIGVAPVHDRFGLEDARIIAPGNPDGSTLFLRVARRGRGQMPQLSTNQVDQGAVDMLRAWIKQLPEPVKPPADAGKSD
ncbi:MAG: hypothetical protein GY917_20340 [Planctomycetaceae bacterium]|nr:hypothetical protein [Planctomycetaceae bacterium]